MNPEHEDSTMKKLLLLLLAATASIQASDAIEPPNSATGDVRVPLANYIKLIEDARNPDIPAPAAYAIGQSQVQVELKEHLDRTVANVQVTANIEVFADQWTLIPILPYGAAITAVTIDGQPIQLVQNAEWMSWSTAQAGTAELMVSFTMDASRSDQGYVLPMPIPRAASTQLTVEFVGDELDLAVIPATDLQTIRRNQRNITTANIPTTSAVLLSWRVPQQEPYVISRAHYTGQLEDDAFTFAAKFQVELFTGEAVKLPILPNTVTLNDLTIDGAAATILAQDQQFKVLLQGRGRHEVVVVFQTTVKQQQGPLSVTFPIPQVAISQFELQLDGKKDLTVLPESQVVTTFKDSHTLASTYVPMTEAVTFSWVDAIPKDVSSEVRANANIYHAISAEEGVLYGRGLIDYEITHGETSSLSFSVPAQTQVNRITANLAGVSDWTEETGDDEQVITVFLDRKVTGQFQLHISYEQLLGDQPDDITASQDITVPLIRALSMHRQRGIVALLAGHELTLNPTKEQGVSRVGENQLPAFFRDRIEQTIAHTFRYTSQTPQLMVQTMAPIRKQGKYDAQVDTLISLGEVTMRGSAGIQIEVKSGGISALLFELPQGVNVLNVSGPSLRNYQVTTTADKQEIAVEFTQEMTGQFELAVNYENILGAGKTELLVPTTQVPGAEVQHGRIAVEALTAVEVQAAQTDQLSTLEINELPLQLVLKTTNPILLAFKYVNAVNPQQLKLQLTRHQELAVQVAAIETANYQTLITDDGLAVTTARFDVRNSRLQFLRLGLPRHAEVWSVFVDGQAEKPAHANQNKGDGQDILIKMLNSATGFPVEVVYATPLPAMGLFGTVAAQLPQPDMVVTHSRWDVYLPVGPNYQAVETNMNLLEANRWVDPRSHQVKSQAADRTQAASIGKPLRLTVPQQGILYTFEKLYANQSDEAAGFQIRYASNQGNRMGLLLSVISVVMIWLAIFALRHNRFSPKVLTPVLAAGIAGLLLSLTYLKINTVIPLSTALAGGVVFLLVVLWPRIKARG